MATDHRPDVRLGTGVGLVVVFATLGPAVGTWQVRDRLPAEVARHWGLTGEVTGTWSLSTGLVLLGLITTVVAAGIGAVAVLSRQPIAVRRMLAGCAVWTATLIGTAQWDALRGQLDLADPYAAPAPTVGLLLGAVGGLAVAVVVGTMATEPAHRTTAAAPPAPELPRRGVSATTWVEDTPGGSRGLTVVVVACLALLAVPAALGSWWVLVVGTIGLAPLTAMTRFRTRIDRHGLRVTALGLTLVHVPVSEVAGVRPLGHLAAFWEFGGWGLRVDVHGRTGVVAGNGPAIAVERADGSEVVVSVTDAERAAATLNALADLRFPAAGR